MRRAPVDLLHVGRGVDHGVPGEIEAGLAPAVEHVDLRRVADAEERSFQRHRIVDAELPDLRFGKRRTQVVVRHGYCFSPSSAFFRSACTGFSPSQIFSSAR